MESPIGSTVDAGTEQNRGSTDHEVRDPARAFVERATSYVRDTADRADERILRMTGKPLGSWTSDTRRWVASHPVHSALLAVGLGYVLGRLFRGGR
jgi:hypothetical protein